MSTFSSITALSILALVLLQSSSVLSGKIDLEATKELSGEKRDYDCENYYYDCPDEGLAVGIIIAIIASVVIFFALIIIGICFCCACCCFAGRRSKGGEVHTHIVYPPANGQNGAYPQQGGAPSYMNAPYPAAQQYPAQGYYGNSSVNPATTPAPYHMKPQS